MWLYEILLTMAILTQKVVEMTDFNVYFINWYFFFQKKGRENKNPEKSVPQKQRHKSNDCASLLSSLTFFASWSV